VVLSLQYYKPHSWFHPTGEEAEKLAKRYWDDKKDKETSIKVRKKTSTKMTRIDLEKPASCHQTQSSTKKASKKSTIGMGTIAARHHTKSSSKKSCKDKSITGMESNSKRGPDGEETVSCHEEQ